MPFALLQSRLDIPEVEALRRAFRGVGGMAPTDAALVARDAYGVLVKGLEHEDALALQVSLAREGVEVEVVNQADLPQLPPGKWFRRAGLRDAGFVGCDPYDRELVIPWTHLAVVSTGLIRNTEFTQETGSGTDFGDFPGAASVIATLVTGNMATAELMRTAAQSAPPAVTRERQVWRWTADLILAGGSTRFMLRSDQLQFLDPAQRVTGEREADFIEFIRAVATHASNAVLNRVAYALREGHDETISYPSRNAYHEELIWLLWRLRQAGHAV